MFEKEAEERAKKLEESQTLGVYAREEDYERDRGWNEGEVVGYEEGFKDGAEFGYNKAKEDVKHDLMMKLKDEGIVKPLKDSIFSNKKLSSQEQQELCAWIECAMDFGENLDECAKELEEANKANEWHYVKDGDLPTHSYRVLVFTDEGVGFGLYGLDDKKWHTYDTGFDVIAWKEIVLPELPKEIK